MSRARARFTQAELRRAMKEADASAHPKAVKVDAEGSIWILPAPEPETGRRPKVEPKRQYVL